MTRAGWVTVLAFLVIVIVSALLLLPPKDEDTALLQLITFGLIFLSALFFMIGISYAKGPLPRWRWGKRPSDSHEEDI